MSKHHCHKIQKLECGPMPNVMAALPNIGGALCSTSQNLATPTRVLCSNAAKTRKPLKLAGVHQTKETSQPLVGRTSFFQLSICALVAKIQPDKVVQWCRDGDYSHHFCVLYFSRAACRAPHFRPAF